MNHDQLIRYHRVIILLGATAGILCAPLIWVLNAGLSNGTTIGLAALLIMAMLTLLFVIGVLTGKSKK